LPSIRTTVTESISCVVTFIGSSPLSVFHRSPCGSKYLTNVTTFRSVRRL